jgi:hypothetical protein
MTQKGVHKPGKGPLRPFSLPEAVRTPASPRAEGPDGCQARPAKAGVAAPAAGGGGDATAGRPTLGSDGAEAPRGKKNSHPSSPSWPDRAVRSRELPCPAGASRPSGRPLPGSMTPADASASAANSSCGWWWRPGRKPFGPRGSACRGLASSGVRVPPRRSAHGVGRHGRSVGQHRRASGRGPRRLTSAPVAATGGVACASRGWRRSPSGRPR